MEQRRNRLRIHDPRAHLKQRAVIRFQAFGPSPRPSPVRRERERESTRKRGDRDGPFHGAAHPVPSPIGWERVRVRAETRTSQNALSEPKGVVVGLSCVSAPSVSTRPTQNVSNAFVPSVRLTNCASRGPQMGRRRSTALPRRRTRGTALPHEPWRIANIVLQCRGADRNVAPNGIRLYRRLATGHRTTSRICRLTIAIQQVANLRYSAVAATR
jgi:hypothetical protein